MCEIIYDFEILGVLVYFIEDLLLERWKKLVWNIFYNSLLVILDVWINEIMGNVNMINLVVEIM